MSENFGAALPA